MSDTAPIKWPKCYGENDRPAEWNEKVMCDPQPNDGKGCREGQARCPPGDRWKDATDGQGHIRLRRLDAGGSEHGLTLCAAARWQGRSLGMMPFGSPAYRSLPLDQLMDGRLDLRYGANFQR